MTSGSTRLVSIATALVVCCGVWALAADQAAPVIKPATTPATTVPPKPAPLKPGEKPPVQVAINALLLEYQKSMAEVKKNGMPPPPPPDPKKHGPVEVVMEPGLRLHSDYFKKEKDKAAGVTPDAIVAALDRSLSNDFRADAYVKWQLLSAIPDKFPKELVARAYRIYRNAPRPAPNPGLKRADLDRALYRVGVRNKDAEGEINAEYDKVVMDYRRAIEPILSYRDELYARLPAGSDTYLAGLGDLYERASQGAPANEHWTTLQSQIRTWGLDCKSSAQLRQVASTIARVRETVRDDRNKSAARVTWDDKTGLKWTTEQSVQQDKSMEETVTWLYQQAENPGGGGLGFKEIKEKK